MGDITIATTADLPANDDITRPIGTRSNIGSCSTIFGMNANVCGDILCTMYVCPCFQTLGMPTAVSI